MSKVNLAISGCMGRMGQQLVKSSRVDKNFKLTTLTESRLIKKCESQNWVYFDHSYYAVPEYENIISANVKYGSINLTAIIEYENGATLAFHTNMRVPDEFRRFAVIGTNGMVEGEQLVYNENGIQEIEKKIFNQKRKFFRPF